MITAAGLHFGRRVQKMVAAEILDLKDTIFSDESHFYIMSKPNRQNFRKLSSTKPEIKVSKPLHSVKVTVWCVVTAPKIIGLFLYEDLETGAALTITEERYVTMLEHVFQDEHNSDI